MELQGTENMMRDLRVLTPLTLVLVIVILAASFRCLRGILLPLGMIALAVVWTLAAMVWSGRPLKVTTMILPSLLISNGTSYVIHFLAQYYRLLHKAYADWGERADAKLDRETYHQALLDAVAYTHSPIFISAATTMAGFGAFIFSGIPAIRDLGIFATVGVFLSYWFCVLLGAVVSLVFAHSPSQSAARRRRQPPPHILGEACAVQSSPGGLGLRYFNCVRWVGTVGAAPSSGAYRLSFLLPQECARGPNGPVFSRTDGGHCSVVRHRGVERRAEGYGA